jgi:hypothetical protein
MLYREIIAVCSQFIAYSVAPAGACTNYWAMEG